jgi:hypothetical protein
MTNVTPYNNNLIRGTLAPSAATDIGTPFPRTCCGGIATLSITTTFTKADNSPSEANTLVKSVSCTVDLGVRAPVVISATPSTGSCAVLQDLLISGACFVVGSSSTPVQNATTAYAVELKSDGTLNTANRINATTFAMLNANLVDAAFNFGSANAGKTFLIFVSGPNGTSRNLVTADPKPAGCVLGNEQGIQVSFTCLGDSTTGTQATVTGCSVYKGADGGCRLTVTGTNFMSGATITVGSVGPKKVKFRNESPAASGKYTTLILKGVCGGLPGPIVVTNVNSTASVPYSCTAACSGC